MEENKDYQVYRFDYLTEGSQLKLEHNVYCEDVDISSLITQGADALEALRQDSIDGEQKALAIVQAAAKQWEQQAAVTQKLNRSLEYLRTPEVAHTGNEWRKTGNWRDAEEISNRVYKMTCSVWEDTKYDRETKQSVPVAWYVTWDVYVNSPKEGYGEKIAGQNQKRYTDKAAAMKYLDGRKKAYSHLFTEISPQIPKEYEHHFTVHGTPPSRLYRGGPGTGQGRAHRRRGFGGRYFFARKGGKAFRAGETGGGEAGRKRIRAAGPTGRKISVRRKEQLMNEWEKNRRMAESYRQSYPPGTRLELIGMDDPFAPIPAGMRGTVNYVDDQSQIHVKWDNGSGLALIPDTDSFRRLSAKEIEAENAAKGSVVSRLTASKTQPGKEREEGRRQAKPNKKKEDMQL